MGLVAAPLATMVSNSFCVLLLGRASFRFLPLRIPLHTLAKYAVSGAVAWGAAAAIEAGSVFPNVALKGTTAVLVYLVMLSILDSRAQKLAVYMGSRLLRLAEAARLVVLPTAEE